MLLKKKQIKIIAEKLSERGISIIPLKVYIKRGYAKILISIAKGKKNYDKRNTLKKKEANREIKRILKEKQKY